MMQKKTVIFTMFAVIGIVAIILLAMSMPHSPFEIIFLPFIYARIIAVALISIFCLVFSVKHYRNKNAANKKPLIISLSLIVFVCYIAFYHGTIRKPNITETDIFAFKEKIESINKEDIEMPVSDSRISTNYDELAAYYLKDYSNENGVIATIFIHEFNSFDKNKEIKFAKIDMNKIFAELLPSQRRLFKAKIQQGEIEGINYIITPLYSDFYEVDTYGGSLWLTYDSKTVLVNYQLAAESRFLSFITHPKPVEWDLLEFLE